VPVIVRDVDTRCLRLEETTQLAPPVHHRFVGSGVEFNEIEIGGPSHGDGFFLIRVGQNNGCPGAVLRHATSQIHSVDIDTVHLPGGRGEEQGHFLFRHDVQCIAHVRSILSQMNIDVLELGSSRTNVLCEGDRKREWIRSSHGEVVVDRFDTAGLEVRFLRLRPEPNDDTISLVADLDDPMELPNGWGMVGRDDVPSGSKTVWIPRPPRQMSVRDHAGRSEIDEPLRDGWRIDHDLQLSCPLPADQGEMIWNLPMVVINDGVGEQGRHLE